MKTLIYFSGKRTPRAERTPNGTYMGCHERTFAAIKDQAVQANKLGQIGYLIGLTHYNGQTVRAIVFFRFQPTKAEILRQRANGFIGARWYPLDAEVHQRKGVMQNVFTRSHDHR